MQGLSHLRKLDVDLDEPDLDGQYNSGAYGLDSGFKVGQSSLSPGADPAERSMRVARAREQADLSMLAYQTQSPRDPRSAKRGSSAGRKQSHFNFDNRQQQASDAARGHLHSRASPGSSQHVGRHESASPDRAGVLQDDSIQA